MIHDAVDLHSSELVRRVSNHLLKRGVRLHKATRLSVEQVDAVGGLFDHCSVTLLAGSQPLLHLPAPYRSSKGARRRPESPDLRRRPFALLYARIKADEPPPSSFDEDGHDGYGKDCLGPKLGLFALREVPDVAVDGNPSSQRLYPSAKACGPVEYGLRHGIVDLLRDSRLPPLVTLRGPQLAVLVHEVLEDVDAACLRGFPKPPQDGAHALFPTRRLAEELVGGESHRVENGVAPAKFFLGSPPFAPLLSLFQSPLHRRAEAREIVLHDVVVGSCSHRLDRHVLPDPARHNDERRFRLHLVRKL